MRSSWLLAVIVALWITGCAEDVYVYRPAEQATATINGLPAGRYAIPPERPVGTVWVASSGTTKVTLASGVTTRMLSVRLVVANNDGESNWVVDTREQRMIVRGLGESRPAFVNTDRQDSPLVTIERGQKRTLDFALSAPRSVAEERARRVRPRVASPHRRAIDRRANTFRLPRARAGLLRRVRRFGMGLGPVLVVRPVLAGSWVPGIAGFHLFHRPSDERGSGGAHASPRRTGEDGAPSDDGTTAHRAPDGGSGGSHSSMTDGRASGFTRRRRSAISREQ